MYQTTIAVSLLSVLCFVTLAFGVRCIKDASKGGDFGQVYAWAMGVTSLACSLFAAVAVLALVIWG